MGSRKFPESSANAVLADYQNRNTVDSFFVRFRAPGLL